MKKLENTLTSHTKIVLSKYMAVPIIVTAVFIIFRLLFRYFRQGRRSEPQSVMDSVRRDLPLYLFVFTVSFILQVTLLGRIGNVEEPFGRLWDGWIISANKYVLELSPLYNVLLLVPFGLLLCKISKLTEGKKIFPVGTLASLGLSLVIEATQAIFCIGTFQISDLVYNTLGGFLGAAIYMIIIIIKRKRKRHRQ